MAMTKLPFVRLWIEFYESTAYNRSRKTRTEDWDIGRVTVNRA